MFDQLENFYQVSSLIPVNSVSYDFEFLLMIVLNNEELLRYSKDEEGVPSYTFNIKNLIETGILQFIIITLSSSDTKIQSVSKVILNKILESVDLDVSFKDKNVYKVYLASTLFTLSKTKSYHIWSGICGLS